MEDKKQKNREHILDVSKKRFGRFGFQKTTLDEICKDAKVSKRTIYVYFKNKEDLFLNLFIRETLSAREEIFNRLGDVEDPLEKLTKLIEISVGYFRVDTFFVNALENRDGLYSPFLSEKYTTLVEEEIVGIIGDILRDGVKQGKIRKIDDKLIAYIVFKIFQSVTYAKTPVLPDGKDNDALFIKELIDFITRGIAKI